MTFLKNITPIRSLLLAAAILTGTATFSACGSREQPAADTADVEVNTPEAPATTEPVATAEPAKAGAGIFTAEQVKLSPTIDKGMVAKGKGLSELKCQSCHSMGANKVVGPGWEDVTKRRSPEWIMNMVVHTDKMLETDPEAQKMLEQCMVRMPNQSLTETEGREILEYMRTLVAKN